MTRVRILLAEDHTLVAEAFQRLLEPHYQVVGIVADGRSLLKVAQQLNVVNPALAWAAITK